MVEAAKNKDNSQNFNAIRADLVMVSDVHLRGPNDKRCELLCDLVDRATRGSVKTLLLLGDIFDFCIGGPKYYEQKYAMLISKLEALAAAGTRVIFLEGNHEFSMTRMPWKHVEVIDEESIVLDIPGVAMKIAVRHGDLLNAPASYKAFRKLLKSKLILSIARAVPPTLLEAYALSHAKLSRSRDPYRILDHQALMAAAEVWLAEIDADYGIFGHFHVPYAEPRQVLPAHPGHPGQILSVSSWDEPNYLFLTEGKFFRGSFNSATHSWDISLAMPYLPAK